ncbi:MAG: hypothetical protein V4565_02840 [Bacteroidota bacterium]
MPHFSVIKRTDLETVEISMCSDGIIRVMFRKKAEINAAVFKEVFGKYNEMVDEKKYPFIYFAEDSSVVVTNDGRDFAKKEEYSFPKVCNAVIVKSLAHKLLASFYFKFNKPVFPFKVFNSMEEAEKWCLQEVQKINQA